MRMIRDLASRRHLVDLSDRDRAPDRQRAASPLRIAVDRRFPGSDGAGRLSGGSEGLGELQAHRIDGGAHGGAIGLHVARRGARVRVAIPGVRRSPGADRERLRRGVLRRDRHPASAVAGGAGRRARRAAAQRHRVPVRTRSDAIVRGARAPADGRRNCRPGRSNFASGPARTTICCATLADAHGVADLVSVLPAIPYREALAEMVGVDALLVMQASNCNAQIPAKVYEYLRAGRPIYALTDPAGDTADLMRRAGVPDIAPLDSADAIAASLPSFIARARSGHRRCAVAGICGAVHAARASPGTGRAARRRERWSSFRRQHATWPALTVAPVTRDPEVIRLEVVAGVRPVSGRQAAKGVACRWWFRTCN